MNATRRPLLTATVGLPGSGKTTWARERQRETGCAVLDCDTLRDVLGYRWDADHDTRNTWEGGSSRSVRRDAGRPPYEPGGPCSGRSVGADVIYRMWEKYTTTHPTPRRRQDETLTEHERPDAGRDDADEDDRTSGVENGPKLLGVKKEVFDAARAATTGDARGGEADGGRR